MKFKNSALKFRDADGDKLTVSFYDGELFLSVNNNSAVVMTREEARKFAKAIRKEVRKVQQ